MTQEAGGKLWALTGKVGRSQFMKDSKGHAKGCELDLKATESLFLLIR